MKINVVKLATIIGKFLPAIRALVNALNKDSDNGKKISQKERDEIIGEFLEILDDIFHAEQGEYQKTLKDA